MWHKEWIVFPFMTGSHFHGVLVNYSREDTDSSLSIRGSINYIDSFLSEDVQHAHLIRDFLSWTYERCVPSITCGQWAINVKTTGNMIRQHMYLAPGQHKDTKIHIDCALYFYFITMRIISGDQPDGISPTRVH